MRSVLAVTGVFALVLTAGCGDIDVNLGSWGKKADGDNGTETAPGTTVKENYQGYYLTVWVDGKRTTDAGKEVQGNRLWALGACSANPKVKLEMDTGHLGELKSVEIVINPDKDGAPDSTIMFKCRADAGMKPGVETRLGKFEHYADRTMKEIDKLPAGKYYLIFSAHGQKQWDRQTILVEVN